MWYGGGEAHEHLPVEFTCTNEMKYCLQFPNALAPHPTPTLPMALSIVFVQLISTLHAQIQI